MWMRRQLGSEDLKIIIFDLQASVKAAARRSHCTTVGADMLSEPSTSTTDQKLLL